MRPDLRTRLLALTLPVTLAAVVAAAWVTNRQTRQEVDRDITRERQKPDVVVETLRQVGQQEQGWDDIQAAVDELARSNHLRIVVFSEDDVLRADSNPRAAVPATDPLVVDPPASTQTEVTRQVLRQQAYGRFTDCLIEHNVPFKAAPDDGDGILKPSVEPGANKDDLRTCNEIRESQLEAAKQYGADALPFQPVKVYLGPTRLESGSLLSSGVSRRLVLTLAAVAALTILLTAFAARRITRPVTALTRAVRRMRSGHLDERVPEDRGDELGELSRAFNAMAASLAEGDRLRRRMTSDVAHELRTPLSNIRGYLEAAQDGVAPLTSELIESLLEDTLLLQALVDDLQDLAVAESGQLRLERAPTDVDDLVASVVAAHQTRAAVAGIRLSTQAGLRTPADVDPRRIRQVLTNLVENAIRHTDSGGRIAVTTRQSDRFAEIVVRDSGVGIPAEDLPHIFDRFYRADPSRQRATGGSGLGLAITRELVTAHGGELAVESALGEGTAFTVRLPLVGASGGFPTAAATPPDAPAPGEARRRRGRIWSGSGAGGAAHGFAAGNGNAAGNRNADAAGNGETRAAGNGETRAAGNGEARAAGTGPGRLGRDDGCGDGPADASPSPAGEGDGRPAGHVPSPGSTDARTASSDGRGASCSHGDRTGGAVGNGRTATDRAGRAHGADAADGFDGPVGAVARPAEPGPAALAPPPPPPPPPPAPLGQRPRTPVDFTYIDVS